VKTWKDIKIGETQKIYSRDFMKREVGFLGKGKKGSCVQRDLVFSQGQHERMGQNGKWSGGRTGL